MTQPSSFSIGDRHGDHRQPPVPEQPGRPGSVGGHQHRVVTQVDHGRAVLLGDRQERRVGLRSVDQRRVTHDRAVGKLVTPDLRRSTLLIGTVTTGYPRGATSALSCRMPSRLVRVPSPTYTDDPTLSTSPPSSRPAPSIWAMVSPRPSARRASRARAVEATSPRRDSAPGKVSDGEVPEHDHAVFDEHPVRVLVRGLDLGKDAPAVVGEGGDVALPLRQGERRIDRLAFQMGQLAVSECRRRPADQDAAGGGDRTAPYGRDSSLHPRGTRADPDSRGGRSGFGPVVSKK